MSKRTELINTVRSMIEEITYEMNEMGIEVLPVDRIEIINSTSLFGYMKIKKGINGYTGAIMGINRAFMDRNGNGHLYNTVAHELIHAIPQAVHDGHGKVFKHYARAVGNRLGTVITRTSTTDEISLPKSKETYKYRVFCDGCGQSVRRKRRVDMVVNPQNYTCICGEKFKSETL